MGSHEIMPYHSQAGTTVKILKPITKAVIKRGIQILPILHGGLNIVKLYDVVDDLESKLQHLFLNDFHRMIIKKCFLFLPLMILGDI